MAQMSQAVETWPTVDEAAAQLGSSRRTIFRYGEAHEIEIRKRAGKSVCNPRDIEKLLPKAHVMPEASNGTAITRMPAEPARALDPTPILAMIRAIATAIETERQIVQIPKLWLSLDEAAEYSGLSVRFLRDSIVEPKHHEPGENLAGIRAGRGGAWRIRRASLEAFSG